MIDEFWCYVREGLTMALFCKAEAWAGNIPGYLQGAKDCLKKATKILRKLEKGSIPPPPECRQWLNQLKKAVKEIERQQEGFKLRGIP